MSQSPPPRSMPTYPSEGPGSPARFLPRLVALIIDWMLCSLIATAFLGYRWGGSGGEGFKPMAVFAVESFLLVSMLGYTVGHRIMGLVVNRVAGGAPGFLSGFVRTLLLLLVVPAVLTDGDGRGLHDRAAGTHILRTR